MKIYFTDDRTLMRQMGQEIFAEKQKIYTDKMCKAIYKSIRANMPTASEAEIEDAFYCAVYDYWAYGNSIDEEFYYDFVHKSHEEKLKYMTFRWRLKYIDALNDPKNKELFVDKYKTYEKFREYYRREVIQVGTGHAGEYEEFAAFVQRHPCFVAKPKGLSYGIGVYKIQSEDYPGTKELYEHLLGLRQEYEAKTTWGGSQAIVLEELIEQDEAMRKIHPESVNGVRVSTVMTDDGVKVYHPWFKVGANGEFITSAVFGTMDAEIDSETGRVISFGYKENGEKHEYHPQTGMRILGFQIPKWNELLELVTDLAQQCAPVRFVGWDMALTPDGWSIMEANYSGDFMWQLCLEKGMRKEFEDMIGWKFEKDFWWEN